MVSSSHRTCHSSKVGDTHYHHPQSGQLHDNQVGRLLIISLAIKVSLTLIIIIPFIAIQILSLSPMSRATHQHPPSKRHDSRTQDPLVEEQRIVLVRIRDQPTHSSDDIGFSRHTSGVLGIVSQHHDIFGPVSESFCHISSGNRSHESAEAVWMDLPIRNCLTFKASLIHPANSPFWPK
jgi:rRNA processing protein Gar1